MELRAKSNHSSHVHPFFFLSLILDKISAVTSVRSAVPPIGRCAQVADTYIRVRRRTKHHHPCLYLSVCWPRFLKCVLWEWELCVQLGDKILPAICLSPVTHGSLLHLPHLPVSIRITPLLPEVQFDAIHSVAETLKFCIHVVS